MFTDLSENETERSWDFEGDGIPDSSEESPVHTYMTPGIYTVNLTASNENGTAFHSLIISVTEKGSDNKRNTLVDTPGFEAIYEIVGLLAVFLYKRN
jgi:PKD repeat protein